MSALDEFYVGYLPAAPPGLARWLRRRVLGGLVLLPAAATALVLAHARLPTARFEHGTTRAFRGVLEAEPYPLLRVARPGLAEAAPGDGAAASRYLLVDPGKHGARASVDGLAGREVVLRGKLAHRDGRTLIELEPGSLRDVGPADAAPTPVPLGRVSLRGEIVDSKCWLGVMNPGSLKPHRACAVRCISGGIPPALCVRDAAGRASYVLLVDEAGGPVNAHVLDLVAEPVEIQGELERSGDVLVLRSDPATYARIP